MCSSCDTHKKEYSLKTDAEHGARIAKKLGGVGSGNFGHEGRPGEVGGSADSGGVNAVREGLKTPGGNISAFYPYGPKSETSGAYKPGEEFEVKASKYPGMRKGSVLKVGKYNVKVIEENKWAKGDKKFWVQVLPSDSKGMPKEVTHSMAKAVQTLGKNNTKGLAHYAQQRADGLGHIEALANAKEQYPK